MPIRKARRLGASLLLLVAAAPLRAQDALVAVVALEGEVRSARTGEPLPFATVQLPGLARSTATDVRGRFRIERVPPREHTLLVRQIGYVRFSGPVTVDGATPADLQLAEDAVVLGGLTVTADRFRMRARRYTGSVRAADRAEIAASPWTDARGIVLDQGVSAAPCASQECVRVRGSVVRPAIFLDDLPTREGLDALRALPRSMIGRVEVLDGGRRIFIYSHDFLERAARSGYRPQPYGQYR